MSDIVRDWQQALFDGLGRQISEYDQLFQILDALDVRDAVGVAEQMAHVRQALNRLEASNNLIADARRQWESLGKPKSERLTKLVGSSTTKLIRLLDKIKEIETQARKSRDSLIPKLNRETATQQMVQAYQSAMEQC